MITFQANSDQLGKALALYVRASGKAVDEVIRQKATGYKGVSYFMRQELAKLSPAKGQVRAERLADLKAGRGVRVRPRVLAALAASRGVSQDIATREFRFGQKAKAFRTIDGKKVNFQALAVRRELNLREAGRGFLQSTARFIGEPGAGVSRSRYGPTEAVARFDSGRHEATMTWGPFSELSAQAVTAFGKAMAQAAIGRALSSVTADIVPYLKSHLGDAAVAAGFGRS